MTNNKNSFTLWNPCNTSAPTAIDWCPKINIYTYNLITVKKSNLLHHSIFSFNCRFVVAFELRKYVQVNSPTKLIGKNPFKYPRQQQAQHIIKIIILQ
jgi:hypothetical protein